MTLTATYTDDNLTVTFTADEEFGDDPTVGHVVNIAIESAVLCGVALDLTASRELALALHDLSDDLEWEPRGISWGRAA